MNGLSIIICSVKPELARKLQKNIEVSAGMDCEFIIIDNRERGLPIAKAYNEGAAAAKYPFLLFCHEDVTFFSSDWAPPIIEKLEDPETGVIGIAGSDIRLNVPSPYSWSSIYGREVSNYISPGRRSKYPEIKEWRLVRQGSTRIKETDFSPVITIDGAAIFVRKDVWEKYPFDEKFLTGFHGYDIDFSLTIFNHGYKNYVIVSHDFYLLHDSLGSFNKDWFETTLRLHNEKWNRMLPAYATAHDLSEDSLKKYAKTAAFDFLKLGLKIRNVDLKDWGRLRKEFEKDYNFSFSDKAKIRFKMIWYRFLQKK